MNYTGEGANVIHALRALKTWGYGKNGRPAPDAPLAVVTEGSNIRSTRAWIEGVARIAVDTNPADADVAAVRQYITWLAVGGFDPNRAEREGIALLAWLTDGRLSDAEQAERQRLRAGLARTVQARWTDYRDGHTAPVIRRGPRPIGSLASDPPLFRLLPGYRLALEGGALLNPPPARGTAKDYLYTLRLLLGSLSGEPTEARLILAAVQNYSKLRSARDAWTTFRDYAGERGLELPEYPHSQIKFQRGLLRPTRSSPSQLGPEDFAPADVVRAFYDLFGTTKTAYRSVIYLKRSDVKQEGDTLLLPERWKDGGWIRWRPLGAAERLGLKVVLAWGESNGGAGEDDPLVPLAPGSTQAAPCALVLRSLEYRGFLIGRRRVHGGSQ